MMLADPRSPNMIEVVSETKESDEADNTSSDGKTVASSKRSTVLDSIKNEIISPAHLTNYKFKKFQIDSPINQKHRSFFSSLVKFN